MTRIRVHIQNMEHDGIEYFSVSTTVDFPAIPRIGETVYLNEAIQKRLIKKILTHKNPLKILDVYRNLIVDHYSERPFLSLQGYCRVEDIHYIVENKPEKSEICLVLGSLDNEHYDGEIDETLYDNLKKSFENNKLFF